MMAGRPTTRKADIDPAAAKFSIYQQALGEIVENVLTDLQRKQLGNRPGMRAPMQGRGNQP